MPPRGEEPVTPEELALVKLWIDQGAQAPKGLRVIAKPKPEEPPANVQPVRAVAVSPDKASIAAGRSNQIHIYDAATGNYKRLPVRSGAENPHRQECQGRPYFHRRIDGVVAGREISRQRQLRGNGDLGPRQRRLAP